MVPGSPPPLVPVPVAWVHRIAAAVFAAMGVMSVNVFTSLVGASASIYGILVAAALVVVAFGLFAAGSSHAAKNTDKDKIPIAIFFIQSSK